MKFGKFDLTELKNKATGALKDAQAKAADAAEKLAPLAEQAGKKIVEADKIVTAKVDEAKGKITEVLKKGRGPK